MPRPLDLPEPYTAGTFAVAAATRDGAKMSSLRALPNPYRGVRSHVLPTTLTERAEALRLVRSDGFALSHCSAAVLHGLPVPLQCGHDEIHVMSAGSRVRRPGLIGHRGLELRETTEVGGQRATTLVDTWLDLAPLLTLDELVVVGDAVARRLESVAPLVAGSPRARTHRQRVREALRWVRVGSASPMETRSRVLFVRGGLPEPELNAPIFDARGGWLAEGDLVWREARTVGEYQGAVHFQGYRRGDKDLVRRRSLEAEGWVYVDFTKDDYYRRARRVRLVERMAAAVGVQPTRAQLAEVARAPGLLGPAPSRCATARGGSPDAP